MNERDLYQFLALTQAYFYREVGNAAVFQPGSIEYNSLIFSEITGLQQISGDAEGFIYLTATHDFMHDLLRATGYRGVGDRETVSHNFMQEILDTIATHVKERFGARLDLKPPQVFTAVPDDPMELPPAIYLTPIDWKQHQAYFGLGLIGATKK